MNIPISYFQKLVKENSAILTLDDYNLLSDVITQYPECSNEKVYNVRLLLLSLTYPHGFEKSYYDEYGITLSFIFPHRYDYKDIPIDQQSHISVENDIIYLYNPSICKKSLLAFSVDFKKKKVNLKYDYKQYNL